MTLRDYFCRRGILILTLSLFVFRFSSAQITPAEAGYIDAVTDYGAVNDGVTVTTAQLQAAIDASVSEGKGLYLPPGRYLVDGTLIIRPPAEDQKFVMQGSSVDPVNRSVIVLKAGTFPDFSNNLKDNLGFVIRNDYGYDGIGTTTTYERIVQSIDIEFEENNAGGVALNFRGAEGTCAFDINIDVTGGYAGIYELPGSGGSIADISITGGKVGIDITHDGGTQPTATMTHLKFSGQEEFCILANSTRGALTITGADVILDPGSAFYRGVRHGSFPFKFGGNPVINDSRFVFTGEDPENNLFNFSSSFSDLSINLTNVYVKNAASIVSTDKGADQTVSSNSSGWRYYKQFNYSSGEWNDSGNTYKDGIYPQTEYISENVFQDYSDVEESDVPGNLVSIHGWGETFPSFESEGAVNVKDYEGYVENGDWAPAFNAAIEAASRTPSNVVFVPTGSYDIYQTIHLGLHTKLIGVSHHHSVILGWDEQGRRFDGSNDSWENPRPMIETPDDINADNILADLGVRVVGPFNDVAHNPEPCVHYAILWRAGKNSIIRNLNTEPKTSTNYRPVFVLKYQLTKESWLNLQSVTGTIELDGYSIRQDNATQFLNHTAVPAGHWLETVNGSQRLMAKSIPPINNHPDTRSEYSNIHITKTDNSAFELLSLKIAQASFNPKGGGNIAIHCYNGENLVYSDTFFLEGMEKPRDEMDEMIVNQDGITEVVLSSPVMFSIDDVVLGDASLDFESLSGKDPAVGEGLESALYYDPVRDLPVSYLNHHIVEITGGVKWYNHRKHGDTWMRPTQAYVYVNDNKAPVNFYHFHAQHSQNDHKLLIENGQDVTVWGIKTENAGYFARVEDSDNIRIFGHGGLTTPPAGAAHYYFDNTTNYGVYSPTDELDRSDYCQYCSSGNAILPQAEVGTYTSLIDNTEGNILKPDPFHRPILWERGNPEPAYYRSFESVKSTISLSNPPANSRIKVGTELKLAASGKALIDSIAEVDFYVGTTLVGTDTLVPFEMDYLFNSTGDFSLSVSALTADGEELQSVPVSLNVFDPNMETVTVQVPVEADVSIENNENLWDSETLRTRTTDNSAIYLKFPLDKVYGDVIYSNFSMYSWTEVESDSIRLVKEDSWIDSLVHITPGPGRTILTAEQPAVSAIVLSGEGVFNLNMTEVTKEENKGVADSGNDTLSLEIRNEVNTSFSKYSSSESQATAGRDYPPTLTVQTTMPEPADIAISSPVADQLFSAEEGFSFTANILQQYQEISTMDFYINGNSIGSLSSAPFSVNVPGLQPGNHVLTVKATDVAGAVSLSEPVSITVAAGESNQLPVVALNEPVESSAFEGENIILKASANDPDGEVIAVKFYYGNNLIGVDERAPYEINWYMVPPGEFELFARAYDNSGEYSDSDTFPIIVISAPEIVLNAPAQNDEFLITEEVLFDASASSESGDIAEVRFYVDGLLVNTSLSEPFNYNHIFDSPGPKTIKAEVEDEFGQLVSQSVNIMVRMPKGPFGGVPYQIPGWMDAENFDEGGNGVSYLDDEDREGNALTFRPWETVDIRVNANPLYAEDTLAIGNVDPGEWMEYTINNTQTDTYRFIIEAAGPRPSGEPEGGNYDRGYCAVYINGDSIGSVMITNTSDDEWGPDAWHSWAEFEIRDIEIPEGESVLRWEAYGSYNVNRIGLFEQFPIGINGNKALNALTVYPNPFKDEVFFRVNLASVSDVSVQLFDITGKVVDVITRKSMSPGIGLISWSPDADLKSGLLFYQLKISTNEQEITTLRGILRKR